MANKIKLFLILTILGLVIGNAIYAQVSSLLHEINDIICSIEEPCSEGLECISFPEIGLRCAQSNPCSYYECPEDTQCFVAESYPLQVICSPLAGAEEPRATETVEQAINLDEDVQPIDLEVNPPTILPDSPFYFLKNLGRGIRTFFTFNPLAKTELREKFANEKLMELKKMVEMNKSANAIRGAAQNYQEEIETVKKFAERIRTTAQENEQVGTFLDKYIQQQTLHNRVLSKLADQVPAEALEKIQASRELHLEKFSEVMQKLEDKDKIAERLEKNLGLVKGSDFKYFINIGIVEALKEKFPEDIRIKIEEKQEEMLGKLHEKLEALPAEKLESFTQYIKQIRGDKMKHLDIIGALEGKELSDKLRPIIEDAKAGLETNQ